MSSIYLINASTVKTTDIKMSPLSLNDQLESINTLHQIFRHWTNDSIVQPEIFISLMLFREK